MANYALQRTRALDVTNQSTVMLDSVVRWSLAGSQNRPRAAGKLLLGGGSFLANRYVYSRPHLA
jgi:hypothetical protein